MTLMKNRSLDLIIINIIFSSEYNQHCNSDSLVSSSRFLEYISSGNICTLVVYRFFHRKCLPVSLGKSIITSAVSGRISQMLSLFLYYLLGNLLANLKRKGLETLLVIVLFRHQLCYLCNPSLFSLSLSFARSFARHLLLISLNFVQTIRTFLSRDREQRLKS